jgi:hypothetical protein
MGSGTGVGDRRAFGELDVNRSVEVRMACSFSKAQALGRF